MDAHGVGGGLCLRRGAGAGLNARRVNYVELDCGRGGTTFLRGALSAMAEENCQIYQATAPALS